MSAFFSHLNVENPFTNKDFKGIFVTKMGKNQLLKAEKINRRSTIIWEVRVLAFMVVDMIVNTFL